MASRTFHGLIVVFWFATMTWLVMSKVLPPLLIGEPPTYRSIMPSSQKIICWQIFWNDKPLGWAATRAVDVEGGVTEVHNRVVIDNLPLNELLPPWLGALVRQQLADMDLDARTRMDIDPLGQLAGFFSVVKLSGMASAVRMSGRVNDGMLDASVQVGELRYKKEVRLEDGALVTGEFSPLAEMPGLRVGQTWTFRSFSPLRPPNTPMEPQQAVVTGEEWVEWSGRGVNALLVECRGDSGSGFSTSGPPRGRMWVMHDGRIIQQEIAILSSTMRFVRLSESDSQPYLKLLDGDPFLNPEFDGEGGSVP